MEREQWERRVPIFSGRAWAFGFGVTAALIVAPEHRHAPDPARFLLASVDPSLPQRLAAGDIVVGGSGFAAGTEDEAPVRAFLGARVGAVVACSFDTRFAGFAFELGLPALEVHEALAIHTGARLRVDLEGARVVNLSSGDRYPIRNLSDALLERFRELHA